LGPSAVTIFSGRRSGGARRAIASGGDLAEPSPVPVVLTLLLAGELSAPLLGSIGGATRIGVSSASPIDPALVERSQQVVVNDRHLDQIARQVEPRGPSWRQSPVTPR